MALTIPEWLNGVHYDSKSQIIFSKAKFFTEMCCQIKGWSSICQFYDTKDQAAQFQDEVGKFIADAINEKIKRDFK